MTNGVCVCVCVFNLNNNSFNREFIIISKLNGYK